MAELKVTQGHLQRAGRGGVGWELIGKKLVIFRPFILISHYCLYSYMTSLATRAPESRSHQTEPESQQTPGPRLTGVCRNPCLRSRHQRQMNRIFLNLFKNILYNWCLAVLVFFLRCKILSAAANSFRMQI